MYTYISHIYIMYKYMYILYIYVIVCGKLENQTLKSDWDVWYFVLFIPKNFLGIKRMKYHASKMDLSVWFFQLSTYLYISHLVRHKPTKWISDNIYNINYSS